MIISYSVFARGSSQRQARDGGAEAPPPGRLPSSTKLLLSLSEKPLWLILSADVVVFLCTGLSTTSHLNQIFIITLEEMQVSQRTEALRRLLEL